MKITTFTGNWCGGGYECQDGLLCRGHLNERGHCDFTAVPVEYRSPMLFISRHEPTDKQRELAGDAGYILRHVGDFDAFAGVEELKAFLEENGGVSEGTAVACVHPSLALKASALGYSVGVFRNANRAPEGEPPQFEAVALELFEMGN